MEKYVLTNYCDHLASIMKYDEFINFPLYQITSLRMMRDPALLILLYLVLPNEVWAAERRYDAYQHDIRKAMTPSSNDTVNSVTIFNTAPNNIKASISTTNNATTYQEYRVDEDLRFTHLMTFLIKLTSGRQIYLVYDDVTPGVGGVLRACREAWVDTTLLPYQPTAALLTETLRAYYHVQPIRNVFVLCSPPHLAALFQKVSQRFNSYLN
nr:uncharacterized protein LOC123758106 [Procambarus clarkii]